MTAWAGILDIYSVKKNSPSARALDALLDEVLDEACGQRTAVLDAAIAAFLLANHEHIKRYGGNGYDLLWFAKRSKLHPAYNANPTLKEMVNGILEQRDAVNRGRRDAKLGVTQNPYSSVDAAGLHAQWRAGFLEASER